MTLRRMDNVGVDVDDLAAAVAFFRAENNRLCYVRGPEGIIVALAHEIGQATSVRVTARRGA